MWAATATLVSGSNGSGELSPISPVADFPHDGVDLEQTGGTGRRIDGVNIESGDAPCKAYGSIDIARAEVGLDQTADCEGVEPSGVEESGAGGRGRGSGTQGGRPFLGYHHCSR